MEHEEKSIKSLYNMQQLRNWRYPSLLFKLSASGHKNPSCSCMIHLKSSAVDIQTSPSFNNPISIIITTYNSAFISWSTFVGFAIIRELIQKPISNTLRLEVCYLKTPQEKAVLSFIIMLWRNKIYDRDPHYR